jgi:hypothetical protein
MNVKETMGNNVEVVKEWYDSLDEKAKETTAIYMVLGDMEGKCNVDFIAGMGEDIMYTLAQSMINDRDFYDIAKAAVELVDKCNEFQIEELKTSVKKMPVKPLS